MSYELQFDESFFFAEGEPDDSSVPIKEQPVSVWEAILAMKQNEPKKWEHMACEVFDMPSDLYLAESTVMDKIRETNSCSNLNSPVQVWVDEGGYFTLSVYGS